MSESQNSDLGPAAAPGGLLRDPVAELNLEILEVHVGSLPALQCQWRRLSGAARLRLASCPFLLVEAGFAQPEVWARLPNLGVHEAMPLRALLARRSALPAPLLHRVLLLAWHMARANRSKARIALGMSGTCAGVIACCRLTDLEALAERRPGWIRPRWDQQAELWGAWLAAAANDSPLELERLQLWGLQMLAAEVRRQRS